MSSDALGDVQWEESIRRYEALAQACADKHNHRDWWLCHTEPTGPSKYWGVRFNKPSWRVDIRIDGVMLHLGTCKCEGDAGLAADFARVALGLAPKNFTAPWDSIKAWVEAGGNGVVPVVERVELRGDVRVNGMVSVGKSEAWDALASAEKDIEEAIATDAVKRDWYYADLSEMSDEPRAEWMASLAGESDDVETVGDLAMVDVFDKDILLALIGRSDNSARRRLWRFKRDAANLLGVRIPREMPEKPGRERSPEHQRVPDGVANRFVAWIIG